MAVRAPELLDRYPFLQAEQDPICGARAGAMDTDASDPEQKIYGRGRDTALPRWQQSALPCPEDF